MNANSPVLALALTFAAPNAVAQERPHGPNCDLTAPPPSAGEVPNHSVVVFYVFPQAKEIGTTYSGCQAVFVPKGNQWIVALLEIVNGDPKRTWAPGFNTPAQDACRYDLGQVILGDPRICGPGNQLLIKSYAPGCFKRFAHAYESEGHMPARAPEGCANME